MAQLDDDVGLVMKKLKDMGVDDNTIVVFTTDNGTEVFTWPDGGQTPFAQSKGTVLEGGFRVPALIRWPGHVPADTVQNGIFSGLDWLPTFVAAAGNPNITEELLKGKEIGGRTYKNHLDGYNQMAAITGKGPSARHEIFYLGESTVGAVRIDDYKFRFIDQPAGWLGEKTQPDVPYITNLRLDPFERTGWPNNGTKEGAQQYFDWFKYQFWRFVFVQQVMGKELQTFLEYPPMQRGASFNLDAVKAEMAKRMEQAEAAAKVRATKEVHTADGSCAVCCSFTYMRGRQSQHEGLGDRGSIDPVEFIKKPEWNNIEWIRRNKNTTTRPSWQTIDVIRSICMKVARRTARR